MRERVLEAAPRLDWRTDDDELGAALVRHTRDFISEQTRARPDDLAPPADAVRRRDRRGRVKPVAQHAQLLVEAGVERKLALDEERRDENDPRAAIGGEPAREIERVLRLLPLEQRHGDGPVGDGTCATRQPVGVATEPTDANAEPHRITWYGTDARITCRSKSSSRLTYSARWLWSARRQPRRMSSGMSTSTATSGSSVIPRR